nr:hypothetical protein CFP56_69533 [Quercus suber]
MGHGSILLISAPSPRYARRSEDAEDVGRRQSNRSGCGSSDIGNRVAQTETDRSVAQCHDIIHRQIRLRHESAGIVVLVRTVLNAVGANLGTKLHRQEWKWETGHKQALDKLAFSRMAYIGSTPLDYYSSSFVQACSVSITTSVPVFLSGRLPCLQRSSIRSPMANCQCSSKIYRKKNP